MRFARLAGLSSRSVISRRLGASARTAPLIAFCLLSVACVNLKVRTDPQLATRNPMRKIAILAEGGVYWPRMMGRPAAVGMEESKVALRAQLPLIENALREKGYEVVFSQPMGIAYANLFPGKDRWVYQQYGKEGNATKKWQIEEETSAFEYPVAEDSPQLSRATRNVFQEIQAALVSRTLKTFQPSTVDVEEILKFTEADTVGFIRILGDRYTVGRKITTALLSPYGTGAQDDLVFFALFASRDGKVLWQCGTTGGYFWYANPLRPNPQAVNKFFEKFPPAVESSRNAGQSPLGDRP